jgi:hypothetical protein
LQLDPAHLQQKTEVWLSRNDNDKVPENKAKSNDRMIAVERCRARRA